MTVAIVIPTIKGRELDLDRCVAAYEETAPYAARYIIRDRPSCGQAWLDGAALAAADGFDHIHFTADDLKPHEGWLEVGMDTLLAGYIPAPLVFHPDGTLESAGLEGLGCYKGPYQDWMVRDGTTVPFLTRPMWECVEMLPIHYTTDLLVSHYCRRQGWDTVVRVGMRFTHYNAPAGRNYGRVPDDTRKYLEAIR